MDKIKTVIIDNSPFLITAQTNFRTLYINLGFKGGVNEWM